MRFFLLPIILFTITSPCFSQSGQWAWMKGDTIYYSKPVWGTKGVGAPANTPPRKVNYNEWQDTDGNFWIYAGGTNPPEGYNDMWKFDLSSGNWIWMHGDSTLNSPAVYGTQGIFAPGNTPGTAVYSGVSWTGLDGRFWLKNEGNENPWVYDPSLNEWAFMGNSGSTGPGMAFNGAATWVDDDGNLWMYGGSGGISTAAIWKYDVTTLGWVFIKGDTSWNSELPPHYGVKGVADASNTPGARICKASWKDEQDNFLFFAGARIVGMGSLYEYDDVWKFSPSINEWTWIGGDSGYNHITVSGVACEFDQSFVPGSRSMNPSCSYDSCGNLWMYGGLNQPAGTSYGELWVYRQQFNDWSLLSSSYNHHYGTIGIPDALNTPGNRNGGVTWFDKDGSLWLFGGIHNGAIKQDLWKYIPDGSCYAKACNYVCDVPTGEFSDAIKSSSAKVHWSSVPAANKYKVRYRITGTTAWINASSINTYKKLKSLQPSTEYDWQVKSNCTDVNLGKSGWSATQNFTTLPQRLSDEENSSLLFEVYPNPTSSIINIQLDESFVGSELFLCDVLGNLKQRLIAENTTTILNVRNFAPGIYFLRVKKGDKQWVNKIFID